MSESKGKYGSNPAGFDCAESLGKSLSSQASGIITQNALRLQSAILAAFSSWREQNPTAPDHKFSYKLGVTLSICPAPKNSGPNDLVYVDAELKFSGGKYKVKCATDTFAADLFSGVEARIKKGSAEKNTGGEK